MGMDLARPPHRPKRVGKVFSLLNVAYKPAVDEYPCAGLPHSRVNVIYALYSQLIQLFCNFGVLDVDGNYSGQRKILDKAAVGALRSLSGAYSAKVSCM